MLRRWSTSETAGSNLPGPYLPPYAKPGAPVARRKGPVGLNAASDADIGRIAS